jgi:ribonuclease P protein component
MLSDSALDGPHVAFAIGRTAGTAVKRNRVRRQLREVLRHETPAMRPGLYLIGLTRPAESITLADLRSAIDGLASKWSVIE